MFSGTSITKANPANFSFEVHLTKEKDEQIVLDLLLDYDGVTDPVIQLKSFDMYIVSNSQTLKIEGCVITQGEFKFDKGGPLILAVSGSGKQLSRVGDEQYLNTVDPTPGTLQSASTTRTPTIPLLDVEVSGADVSNLVAATLQVQNNIDWTPYETLQDSLSVTNASNAMYPSSYSLNDRVVSGNITQFYTNANQSEFQTFNTNTSVVVKTLVDGNTFLNANLTGCMFTKRSNPAEVFTQTYDYRLVTSPNDLGTIITY
jgi:hypothetical protein